MSVEICLHMPGILKYTYVMLMFATNLETPVGCFVAYQDAVTDAVDKHAPIMTVLIYCHTSGAPYYVTVWLNKDTTSVVACTQIIRVSVYL